ncbi:MAG: toll/interleukin-1 receptor domain-containing protein [Flavobacteriaceae bacterium]|nr:toll/interleukin-1 receptor domain-containing protein [Flavobacteriaceae bacterium]
MEKPLNIFISYSWDSDAHKKWVVKLANYLIEKGGCEVILDQYDLKAGDNMVHFMEDGVSVADKVVLLLTPNYKLKADKRQGGVGMEYSMISQGMYLKQTNNNKFIPVLREGSLQSSAPTYVQTKIYHDMTDDILFEKTAIELLRIVHEEPKLVKPERGEVPDFSKGIIESKKTEKFNGFDETFGEMLKAKNLEKELKALYTSAEGVQLVVQSASRIYEAVEHKALKYLSEQKIPVISKRYNNHCSLRLQAGDYYAIADYIGSTKTQVILISIKLRTGVDKSFNPNQLKDNPIMTILYGRTDENKYFPFFKKDKTVGWKYNEVKYTEEDIVDKMFSLLLEEMSKVKSV